ncbi:MAG: glycosyltransferase [Phycisphaera sp.]|nr:glycosyltransferase [Phycisphaera sp.]
MGHVGVVVIGRNEGERLVRCLKSLDGCAEYTVYVDSGSTDGSVERARELGVDVVELDMDTPFTMARGRNAGLDRLREMDAELAFVQFVDGDCEVRPGWMSRAAEELVGDSRVAAVFGRRRERDRDASVYNRLVDMEWHGDAGDVAACGGDVMMRAAALDQVGAYTARMIAGEEPELCIRLGAAGWIIRRLDDEMTLHDAAIGAFSQWWQRTVRSGYACAETIAMHGRVPGFHDVHIVVSAISWVVVTPLVIAASAWLGSSVSPWWWGLAGVLIVGYAWLVLRMVRWRMGLGDSPRDAALFATFAVLAKPAQVLGVMRYVFNRLFRRPSRIIEYKAAGNAVTTASTDADSPS